MCLGGGGRAPTMPTPLPAPVRRQESGLSNLFARRRKGARGTLGNIFTSPLGVSSFGSTATTAIKLGNTSPNATVGF